MPTILRSGAFRVVIHTKNHRPAHVHVWSREGEAKIDVSGFHPRIVGNRGVDRSTAAEALRLVREHKGELITAWRRIHGI